MKNPNVIVVGDIHHINDFDPIIDDGEILERVESIERAVLIQFPDHASIKQFLKTGTLDKCSFFGEGG